MQIQLSENLEIYPKFTEVFSDSEEFFRRLFLLLFATASGEKLPRKLGFLRLSRFLHLSCHFSDCVGTGTTDPHPLNFAKINARGGGGLRETSPQRSDPPPRACSSHAFFLFFRERKERRSVPVLRILIFISRFDAVVLVTQGLPEMPVFQGFSGNPGSYIRFSDCVGTGTADPRPL